MKYKQCYAGCEHEIYLKVTAYLLRLHICKGLNNPLWCDAPFSKEILNLPYDKRIHWRNW